MRTVLFLFILLFFSQCATEEKKEETSEGKSEQNETTVSKENPRDFQITALPKNNFAIPFFSEFNEEALGNITFEMDSLDVPSAKITFQDGTEDLLKFNFSELIPFISTLALTNEFHQQLSVYLFEKQWHTAKVESKGINKLISYYEVSNPPKGEFWFLNAIQEKNKEKKIIASYKFKLPDWLFKKYFEQLNRKKYMDFKNYLFSAPSPQKIEYNKLRIMGKFYEGFAASMNDQKFDFEKILSSSLFSLKMNPKSMIDFYENQFQVPEITENGYDSTRFTGHSISELYASNGFSYKTSYPIHGGKDSLLEMQIDFKSKENLNTIRFVMGGIEFKAIPKLDRFNLSQGLYLPLGFSKYKNVESTNESFVMMGNTSGLWTDNTYGRNIDGVILYFDKNSKNKIHIWLMGGDATIPVGHYITSIDQVNAKR
jgi:hypothetical protein